MVTGPAAPDQSVGLVRFNWQALRGGELASRRFLGPLVLRSARLSLSWPGVGMSAPGFRDRFSRPKGPIARGVRNKQFLTGNICSAPLATRQFDRASLSEKGRHGRDSTEPITHP